MRKTLELIDTNYVENFRDSVEFTKEMGLNLPEL